MELLQNSKNVFSLTWELEWNVRMMLRKIQIDPLGLKEFDKIIRILIDKNSEYFNKFF